MSGGTDSVEDCVSKQPELVDFLRFTQSWVDRRNWKDLSLQLCRDVVDLAS